MSSTSNLVARKTGSIILNVPNFSQQSASTNNYRVNPVSFSLNDECFSFYFGVEFIVPRRNGYTNLPCPLSHTSVYLLNYSAIKSFKFYFNVSILNVAGGKLLTKEYMGTFDDNYSQHCVSLLPLTELLEPKNGFLYYDKLTLLCEVKVIEHPHQNSIQKDLHNLSNEMQSLLTDCTLSDATLIVGTDGKKLHVHKNILSTRSPVFGTMLEYDCEVRITDFSVEVCEEMVRYIYTGVVHSLDQYAMQLLSAADKYQLNSLKTVCEHYLCNTVCTESAANSWPYLIMADLLQATKLKTKCLEYISLNVEQVEATSGWKELENNVKLVRELFFYSVKKK